MSAIPRSSAARRGDEGLDFARLMEYSERRLMLAAQSGQAQEAQLAMRLLHDVPLYRKWEYSHGQLMQRVAAEPRRRSQAVQLKRANFQTLHRKAPFEYLRDRHVTGPARRQLVAALFGPQPYAQCMIREHAAYLSSACSYLCTDSLCADVLRDEAFCEALAHYESAYSEYYRAYCDSLLAEQRGEIAPIKSLLPYLRYQLKIIREHMLAGGPKQSDFMDLQALYASTGDTQKLPTLRER